MRDPIIDIEGRARGIEVAIIEREQVLILLIETLDRVRLALGEIPYVAYV